MVNAQYAQLVNATKPQPNLIKDVREPIEQKIRSLKMNLSQVRSKANTVKLLQSDDYWQTADCVELEKSRNELRDIIHLREGGKSLPPVDLTPILDIKEDRAEYNIDERASKIRTVDYEIYRQEVEATLTPLFETNSTLQKIRAGESISEQELEDLNAMVHTQNERVDLKLLEEFFPDSAVSTDQLLRAIIGLDREAIEDKFNAFLQEHHIHLSSLQQRFIALLKGEICRTGSMTVDRLYDTPFSNLHQDGIDGLFKDDQANLIATFVAGFTVESGTQKQHAKQHLTEQTKETVTPWSQAR